ncbi:hypothetical protein KIN20_005230 [Parelaphostrongylus tenuis]|uniref:Uncharacterized protein n=1 Tax=Parelaphostrongylus tenuis TaxID=148309 RepID=A0AAD5MSH9_PARTN|nr:hypothetical protein KIN20_005230 [Parelaphostrongylus tenuis]
MRDHSNEFSNDKDLVKQAEKFRYRDIGEVEMTGQRSSIAIIDVYEMLESLDLILMNESQPMVTGKKLRPISLMNTMMEIYIRPVASSGRYRNISLDYRRHLANDDTVNQDYQRKSSSPDGRWSVTKCLQHNGTMRCRRREIISSTFTSKKEGLTINVQVK